MPFSPRIGIAVGLLFVLPSAIFFYISGTKWLFEEDGVVEWTSALLFFCAACLAALSVRHSVSVADRITRFYVLVLASLCGLSELSFGARLFGWDMPDMHNGGELDGGQDLVLIAMKETEATGSHLAVLGFLAMFVTIMIVLRSLRSNITKTHKALPFGNINNALVLYATVVLVIAVGIDVFEQPSFRFIEEPLELIAALMMVLSQYLGVHPKASSLAAVQQ